MTARYQYELRLQQAAQATTRERCRFGEIIGASPAMRAVYERIVQAASTDATVMICGETGTGKELIARTIHHHSLRQAQPFVAVNCGAIPKALFESEFFGHCKGAFTDATTEKAGYLAQAHQGTLFLDEVAELTPVQQVKLLRVLDHHAYYPVGSDRCHAVDVRIMAATNRDLPELVTQGRLRQDFLDRLHSIPMLVPPLRERKDDLPLLIVHIMRRYPHRELSKDEFGRLYAHSWPGNVRELWHVLERYAITGSLEFLDMSRDTLQPWLVDADTPAGTLADAVAALERHLLVQPLKRCHWHRGRTAAALGLPERTLRRKIKKYAL